MPSPAPSSVRIPDAFPGTASRLTHVQMTDYVRHCRHDYRVVLDILERRDLPQILEQTFCTLPHLSDPQDPKRQLHYLPVPHLLQFVDGRRLGFPSKPYTSDTLAALRTAGENTVLTIPAFTEGGRRLHNDDEVWTLIRGQWERVC